MSTPTAKKPAALEVPLTSGDLSVNVKETKLADDRSSATVVIECKNPSLPTSIERLRSSDARKLAIAYAASQGITTPALSGAVRPVPFNAAGEDIGDHVAAGKTFADPACKVSFYRAIFPLSGTGR